MTGITAVNVVVNELNDQAARRGVSQTSLTAELMAQVDGIPESDRHAAPDTWSSLLVGQMPLVRQAILVRSARPEHGSRVETAVRAQVEAIGARMKAVNPSR
jgi:hypothetical protein